jgi:hypothetical protein
MTGEVGPRQTFEMEQDRFVPADDVKVAGDQTSHGEVECAAEDGWGDAQGHGVGIWQGMRRGFAAVQRFLLSEKGIPPATNWSLKRAGGIAVGRFPSAISFFPADPPDVGAGFLGVRSPMASFRC